MSGSSCFFRSSLLPRSSVASRRTLLLVASVLLAIAAFAGPALSAQAVNRITQALDTSQAEPLPHHHPLWASPANSTGLAPADLPLNQITLVLSRSAQQEAAFQQFLADQQNPASPNYHHWLTPAEVGDRFGLSDQDIATIAAWLQSQGLHVNWVAPSRIFIGFSGTAADVGRAFQTEMRYYNVSGEQRLSVSSDPMLPAALAPAIKSIRGLYTINERPFHQARAMQSVSPQETSNSGNHYLAPADFATIYDLPSSLTGAGMTIGILDRSRTDFADFSNFRSLTGSSFPNPNEVVPTAFGGLDPGAAYTAPPGGTTSISEQGEATLDVLRAGSVAPGANLLLVVATAASGGIEADAQYLVETTPVPAQVMTISFGECESNAGTSGVTFWDTLFQQAAVEGISVFVSSGDAGASGCDTHGSAPPASPLPNSPNYICSSSYATCVGGTQFNDTSNPSQYWISGNGSGLKSVLSYIPEDAWNESTASKVAATGGGVSSVIATPSWQTGTGVPAAQAGRYTPDISFSASGHDGYFACFAAAGASCVPSSGGSYTFEAFSGTSASAPDMAGITALLDQKSGAPQGNLNPAIYSMATTVPTVFHDVTVATSGVTACDVNTASMCNNSIALLSGSGAQPGYLLTTGYDEVTGLGSLDVSVFLNNYSIEPTIKILATPPSLTFPTEFVGYPLTAQLVVQNSGSSTLNPLTIAITGTNASDFTETDGCQSALTAASACMIQVTFKPVAAGSRSAVMTISSSNATNSPQSVPLTGTGSSTPMSPLISVIPSPTSITTAQPLTVTIYATHPSNEYPTPTGSVTLTSGTYSSGATPLVGGSAIITVSAGALAAGTATLTAAYTPDSSSSSIYSAASGTSVVSVGKATPAITWATPAPINYGTALSATQLNATASVAGTFVYSPAAGTVLTAGSQVLSVTFTPTDTTDYNTATGTVTLTVNKATPTVTWSTPAAITYGTALSATQLNATASVAGTFVYSPAAATVLTAGSQVLGVTFTPTDTTDYNTATRTVTLTVNKATPVITWNTPAAVVVGTALSATQLNATANTPGTFVYNPAAGTVMSTVGSTTLSTTFTPTDTTNYNIASASVTLTVATVLPSFTVSGTPVTISTPGATTGNTSTITVTPANSFTGSVALTAAITSSPSGAQFPPTLSFGSTSPVSITSASPGQATLTVSTTASQSTCTAINQTPRGIPWYAQGGAALACVLLFAIAPRRKGRAVLGMLMLLVALVGGILACGGGSQGTACSNVVTAGTTLGTYTITLTGNSNTTTATNTITLTVQ